MARSRLRHVGFLSLALLLPAASVSAQWAWRDTNGSIQYSDTPPPSSVPQNRILKQPRLSSDTTPSEASTPSPENGSSEKATPSWVEQNTEFVKRRQQRLEQEQKQKDAKQAALEKKKLCVDARENLRIYESGAPVMHTAFDGERRYMNQQERTAKIDNMRQLLKDCR